jgi:hypothetical protein
MKNILWVLGMTVCAALQAQAYVDIFKINQGQASNIGYQDTSGNTIISDFNASLTYPIKLSEKNALITGIDYSRTELKLSPAAGYTSLNSLTAKIGLSQKYNDRWSGTYVLLPKIASDFKQFGAKNYQFGAFGLLKYKKSENMAYKFGLYGSSENFGLFIVPFFGFYYLSPNKKLEVNTTLPIYIDINYKVAPLLTLGTDFNALVRGYNLNEVPKTAYYVHKKTQEVLGYLQLNLLKNSLLIQAKAGYAFNHYEVYENKQKLDFGLSAWEFPNNKRTLYNPEMQNGLITRVQLTYRYNL